MKRFSIFTSSIVLVASALAGTVSEVMTSKPSSATGMTPTMMSGGGLPFTGSVATGYDSSYYFRGFWFANNTVWGSVNVSVPLAEKWSFGLGGLYTRNLDTDIGGGDLDYTELDLSASLNYDAGFARFGLIYTREEFPHTFSGGVNGTSFGFDGVSDSTLKCSSDVGLTMVVPVGAVNFSVGGWYDLKISAFYFEAGVDYTVKVGEKFSLVPSVQLGYAMDYYTYEAVTGVDDGLTHVRTALSAPYKVTDAFTVTPYVAMNFSLEGRRQLNTVEAKNDLYGGVSLNYGF